MSFKYLYNILRTKFNTEPEANNFWGQTQQIKKILSREEYSKYKFLVRFIEDIEFTKLYDLNTAAHNSDIEERKISDIKKYMQNISDTDLNKVVNFFNNLPKLNEFIKFHLIYFLNPKKAEEKFQELVNYEKECEKLF